MKGLINALKSKYDTILFDLDGTLSRSAEGIRNTIEYTLKCIGKPIPDLSDYGLYIGPPLRHTLLNVCGLSNDEADFGVEIYRKRYNEYGKYLNRIFDGTAEMLSVLKSTNARMAVASSKYEPSTREIIEILKISQYFDAVCGSNMNETRAAKQDIINYALSSLGTDVKDRAVMVGDTKYDAAGAKKAGINFIGVAYGYGSIESMKEFGAKEFAENPAQLLRLLTTDD